MIVTGHATNVGRFQDHSLGPTCSLVPNWTLRERDNAVERLGNAQNHRSSSEPFRTIAPTTELRLQVWIVTEWEGKIENHAPDEHDEIACFNADELLHIELTDDQLTGMLRDALARHPRTTPGESA